MGLQGVGFDAAGYRRTAPKISPTRRDLKSEAGSIVRSQQHASQPIGHEDDLWLRKAFDASTNAIVFTDLEGRLTHVNPAFLRMVQCPNIEAALGRPACDFWHAPHAPRKVHESILVEGRWFGEFRARRLDDSLFVAQMSATLIRDSVGQPTYMLGAIVDVTDRVAAEAALEQSEAKFRAIFEQAAAGVALIDAVTGRFLRVNDQLCKLIGYTRGEIHRVCCMDISHPDDLSLDLAYRERIRCGELQQFTIEKRLFRKDGSTIWVNQAVSPLRLDGTHAAQYIIVLQDITEQKRAEAAMRESETRLGEAQRIAHIGSWEWDIPSDSLIWSDEVYRIFGYHPQSFTPRYEVEFMQAIHEDDRDKVSEAVAECLRTGKHYAITHRIVRADGSQRTVRETGEVDMGGDAVPVRMIGNVQDITELAQVEEQTKVLRDQLAHVSRRATMSEMATGLAHEFNQPLAAIGYYVEGSLDALKRCPDEAQCLAPTLEEIARLTTRCADIVKRLRRLVAKQPPQFSNVDLNGLVADVLSFLDHLLRNAEISVHVKPYPTSLLLHVDAVQIQQVLVNIVMNAIESQAEVDPERRELVVRTRLLRNHRVEIAIKDRGKGIAPADANRLFEPFFTTKPTGLGMGLKICQSILLDHGGDLTFKARRGGGSEFIVTLPVNWRSDQ